jgi:hypothetical protein
VGLVRSRRGLVGHGDEGLLADGDELAVALTAREYLQLADAGRAAGPQAGAAGVLANIVAPGYTLTEAARERGDGPHGVLDRATE